MRSIRLTLATALTGALAGALALMGPASPAQAYDGCSTRTTTKAFAAFGDTNEYFPITNSTFESGNLWPFASTGGAYVVNENEPWRVLASWHSRSVALPPGATLTLKFCMQVGEDSVRAFVKSPTVSGSRLNFDVTVSSSKGSSTARAFTTSRSGKWEPTDRMALYNLVGHDPQQSVTVVVKNAGSGTWLMDDFLVDPWKTR
jgi:hypothetical protein